MNPRTIKATTRKQRNLITILSITIPLIVAALFGIKVEATLPVFLPPIYAGINALTAVILVTAIWAIKKGKRQTHERLIKTAMGLSVLFLLLYIIHHMTSAPTAFGGEGLLKTVYYFILITHILLSIAVIPVVLITYARAHIGAFEQHKKIARIAFPLWLYVALTGVLVYLMIAPYYA